MDVDARRCMFIVWGCMYVFTLRCCGCSHRKGIALAPNRAIHVANNPQGQPSGEVFVVCADSSAGVEALKRDRKYMGPRYVEVGAFFTGLFERTFYGAIIMGYVYWAIFIGLFSLGCFKRRVEGGLYFWAGALSWYLGETQMFSKLLCW